VAAAGGSDDNPGTVLAAFRTVQRLADSLLPGQTGCLRGGVYAAASGGQVLQPSHGGTTGAPITIRSYPGERATLVGIVEIPNGVDDVTLSSLTIEGTGGQNTIQILSSDDIVEDSDITNAWRGNSCMILGDNNGWGQAVRPIVRRNRFHECGNPANGNKNHAIYASNVLAGQIVDNLFWNSAALTIQLYPNAQTTRFAHNVVDGDAPSIRGGAIFGGDASHSSNNNLIENNIIAYAQTYNIDTSWDGSLGSGNIARSNCLWAGRQGNINTAGGGFTSINNTTTDPLFLNKTNHDYRLQPTSPCLPIVGYDTAALLSK
jgi:hypothetical protein